MKKLSLLIFLLLISISSLAHAFQVDGIFYEALSDSTVEVVVADKYENYLYYHGDIKIPATIKYNNTEYKVTSIGYAAFNSCDLFSIELPEGITSIGSDAFMGCDNLYSINIPENITAIKSFTFWGCRSLKSINIPDNIEKIEMFTFWGCESLQNINLPPRVSEIKYAAFLGCSSLTSIILPATVESIDKFAFESCTSLESVSCLSDNFVFANSNAFYNIDKNAILYVKADLIEEYENSNWAKYFSQILPLEDRPETGAVEEIEIDNSLPFDVYGLSGVPVKKNVCKENLKEIPAGIYILRQGNASKKIILR